MNYFSSVAEINAVTRAEFEETCLTNVDHLFIGDDTVLCKVLGKHKMYVDSKDLGIAPHLIMDGFWESWVTLLLAQIIQPGFKCLDIGANFGYFSILMSEIAGAENTLSIEPNPRIAELLRCTSFVNGGKFKIIEAALSNKKGEATLTINDRELGGGTIKQNDMQPGRSQLKVQTISVDELVQEKFAGRVDVIKIDVEGMEPYVFEGMKNTIKNNPQLQIVLEFSPSIYDNAQQFTDYLFENFTVFQIKDVDAIKELNTNDIARLVNMTDHTDLYLRAK